MQENMQTRLEEHLKEGNAKQTLAEWLHLMNNVSLQFPSVEDIRRMLGWKLENFNNNEGGR